MIHVPDELRQRLKKHSQEHVLAFWDRLDDNERRSLLAQLQELDFDQLKDLYEDRNHTYELPSAERIKPIPVIRLGDDNRVARRLGEEALGKGEVAVLVVAGGQGSRLGFEHPKGMFPAGPVSGKSLFQLHAEKVLALGRRHGKTIPFLVMTSPATHDETVEFFVANRFFGLSQDAVSFFRQGTMPALDRATGRLLLARPGELFTSPNGHGGTLTALADSGLLARLDQHGIRHIYYFQVDNPLARVGDAIFLGHHLKARAEVSAKIIPKRGPKDKLGNMVLIDGRCSMIEYSDLPDELAHATDEQGRLRLWAGSPAIHYFDVEFLKRVTSGKARIPFHIARKKVPYVDESGNLVEPVEENAYKFERFIFDVLPLAERWAVVETSRREEFEPLKNATGLDSPATVQAAISNLAADWLGRAGVTVPRRPDGSAAVPLEISPLHALDAEELSAKVNPTMKIEGPTYLK